MVNYPGGEENLRSKGLFQQYAETSKLTETNGEILTDSEVLLVENLWRKARRFKIELEDLLQEARLAKCSGEDVQEHLSRYVRQWGNDPCSAAELTTKEYKATLLEADAVNEVPLGSKIFDQARASLTENEYTAIELKFADMMSYSMVAEEMGISEFHAKRLIKKALLKLKRKMLPPAWKYI